MFNELEDKDDRRLLTLHAKQMNHLSVHHEEEVIWAWSEHFLQ
jgi:hypothetical protein